MYMHMFLHMDTYDPLYGLAYCSFTGPFKLSISGSICCLSARWRGSSSIAKTHFECLGCLQSDFFNRDSLRGPSADASCIYTCM